MELKVSTSRKANAGAASRPMAKFVNNVGVEEGNRAKYLPLLAFLAAVYTSQTIPV